MFKEILTGEIAKLLREMQSQDDLEAELLSLEKDFKEKFPKNETIESAKTKQYADLLNFCDSIKKMPNTMMAPMI